MKLNLRSIDLNLLTIFDAIWEERQMSRAAARLNMTQPAASHALARLRTTFDDELFIRSRQGMKPTARAHELAGPVRSALLQIQQAVTPHTFDPETTQRQFTVAFARYGELNLFPTLLKSVANCASTQRIRSYHDDGADVFDAIKDTEVDFGFDYRKPKDPILHSCLFEQEEMVVIARRGHPRLHQELTEADYFRETHIVLTASKELRVFYENVFSSEGAFRTILAEAQQAIAIPNLVMQTDAIATVPRGMAKSPLFAPHISTFPLPLPVPTLPIYLIWHKAMERDAGHRWLKEKLLSCRSPR
jgi:LysR family transcriptional activator for leuABCD operon